MGLKKLSANGSETSDSLHPTLLQWQEKPSAMRWGQTAMLPCSSTSSPSVPRAKATREQTRKRACGRQLLHNVASDLGLARHRFAQPSPFLKVLETIPSAAGIQGSSTADARDVYRLGIVCELVSIMLTSMKGLGTGKHSQQDATPDPHRPTRRHNKNRNRSNARRQKLQKKGLVLCGRSIGCAGGGSKRATATRDANDTVPRSTKGWPGPTITLRLSDNPEHSTPGGLRDAEGGFGTRPWWLALVACGGAYWPLAFEPSAMTSRASAVVLRASALPRASPCLGGGGDPECNFCPWRPPLTA